jgi:hypothetical protein
MTSGGEGRLVTKMRHEPSPPHVIRNREIPDAGRASPLAQPPENQAYELEPKDAGVSE